MNKILNINLGGYALTIDDDAYQAMSEYLDLIRRRFSASEGCDEIMNDIENRLGELIAQGLGNRTIVMMPDVQDAINTMGKPEDFGDDPAAPPPPPGSTSNTSGNTRGNQVPPVIRTGKRLYRDMQDASVGGVCAGLAAYFGMPDPVWMRLIFVLLTIFSTGFWFLAYLLLWALMPPAMTAADRLAMRGEPVNVDNIAREIENGFHRMSSKMEANNSMKNTVSNIGDFFGSLLRFVGKFAFGFAILIAILIFISIFFGWIAGIIGLSAVSPAVEYFSPFSSGWTWMLYTTFFLFGTLTLVGMFTAFLRLIFNKKIPAWFNGGVWLFWTLSLIATVIFVAIGAKDFSSNARISQETDLRSINSDTLHVQAISRYINRNAEIYLEEEGFQVLENEMYLNGPLDIRVQRAAGNNFECEYIIRAQGQNMNDAMENARAINYQPQFSGSTLQIPTGYSVPQGRKWRGQRINLTIYVPVGKFVTFDNEISTHVHDVDYDYSERNQGIYKYPNRVYRMMDGGLRCVDCPAFGDRSYRSDERYEDFLLEGNFETELRHSDHFSIEYSGAPNAQSFFEVAQNNDRVRLTAKTGAPAGLKVVINTPVFTSLIANETGNVTLRDFDEGQASISVRGTSKVKAYMECRNLEVSLVGRCTLDLIGKGTELSASLTDGAVLEALTWRVQEVSVNANQSSKARVFASERADTQHDGSSEVQVQEVNPNTQQ